MGVRIADLNRSVVAFFERLSSWEAGVVRGSNLTLAQAHTLEILGEFGPLRMKELAEKMGITTGTLTVQVDRLEKRGLAERKPHETDRRSFRVALTAKGTARFEEHHGLHLQLMQEITADLDEKDVEKLTALLDAMSARF